MFKTILHLVAHLNSSFRVKKYGHPQLLVSSSTSAQLNRQSDPMCRLSNHHDFGVLLLSNDQYHVVARSCHFEMSTHLPATAPSYKWNYCMTVWPLWISMNGPNGPHCHGSFFRTTNRFSIVQTGRNSFRMFQGLFRQTLIKMVNRYQNKHLYVSRW